MEAPLKVQMTVSQRELWKRISDYQFDDPEAVCPFTERLAQENGWSLGFALRVEEEYRRFAFLAVAAGHPVSPPDAVDQAWHLHQLYSDAYWKEFNGQVLGVSLSHQPTKGGLEEQAKFADWYKLTLESYARFFDRPPSDIWPPLALAHAQKHEYTRVDRNENWVFPKAKFKTFGLFLGLVVMTALSLAAAGSVLMGESILDARGPDFLGFYLLSLLGLLVLAFILVSRARFRPEPVQGTELHPYELAYLSGGREAVVYAAIARLIKEGSLRREFGGDTFAAGETLLADPHPIEEHLYRYAQNRAGGCTAFSLSAAIKMPVSAMANGLEASKLLLSTAQYWRIRAWVAGLFGGLVLLGADKILLGLSRSRPVLFLVFLTGLTIFGCLMYCWKMSRLTSRGKTLLETAQDRSRSLANWACEGRMEPTAAEVALMVGVLGLSTLPAVGMSDLRRTLAPPAQATGDGSVGSSCGASSCGGGGSSSGCGGGGCGGCGGS